MKNKLCVVAAFLILLLAFGLRFINLEKTPFGFHADEASFYINAQALATTGMDEDGNKFPLSLASIIDPKPALYSYFQVPFVLLIDNPTVAARLPAVILGLFSILAVYYFMKEVSNKTVAVFSSILLAISPWHIVVSRATHEVIASFLFLVLALLFLTKYLKAKSSKLFLSLFTINSFLSMYLYHSAKVVVPLLVFVLLLSFYIENSQQLSKTIQKNIKQIAGVLLLTVIAGVVSLFVQESSSRISAVSFLSDPTPQQQLLEQIYSVGTQLPAQVTRIVYNKPTAYLSLAVTEYIQYFSPQFLFLKGGFPTRYIVDGSGLLYLIELPLILFGLFMAIRKKDKNLLFFLSVIFLSPIPASLNTQ